MPSLVSFQIDCRWCLPWYHIHQIGILISGTTYTVNWKEPSSKRTVSRKKIRSILTCDAVDRAEGENALAAFTASANTRTDLENIIVYLFIIFRDPDVVLLYSFNISERRCKMCLIDVCFLKVAFACFSDGYRSLPWCVREDGCKCWWQCVVCACRSPVLVIVLWTVSCSWPSIFMWNSLCGTRGHDV